MSQSLTVFLLCAGLGTRLQPLTRRIPKPLIPFQGQSALEINYRQIMDQIRLRRDLFSNVQVVCNTHHLSHLVEYEATRLGIKTIHENEILGTGGCLWNAEDLLEKSELILCHNADLLHTIDLTRLVERQLDSTALGTLATIFSSRINTLSRGLYGQLLGVHGYHDFEMKGEVSRATFAGIALYKREFLDYCPRENASDIKEWWGLALSEGKTIQLQSFGNSAWHDFGSPQSLWAASKWYMEQCESYNFDYIVDSPSERPYVSNEARLVGLPGGMRNLILYEVPEFFPSRGTHNRLMGEDFDWVVED